MARAEKASHFIAENGWGAAEIHFLQGDASSRKYERLTLGGRSALFVDSPKKKDGPPIKAGRTYSEIAHLAEDVRPFIAVSNYLRKSGFTAPEIYAASLDEGFMLLEDLGLDVFGEKIAKGDDMDEAYHDAVDVLARLAALGTPPELSLPDGTQYQVPYFDEDAFLIEAELLTQWFWQWLDISLPQDAENSFRSLWRAAFSLIDGSEKVLTLRDYHSPNIIWCPARDGIKRAGLIDFQDAVLTHSAYDLVSLLQDARTDIPAEVEDDYKSLYLKKRVEADPLFDAAQFEQAYAIMGAQRSTKILGIFPRLALRDGKAHYLAHIPRVMGYLERCLQHPALEGVRAWYDTYLPEEMRMEIRSVLAKQEIGRKAIILSAGLGKRMAPLSDTCPKPMIKVSGTPLLKYGLDKLSAVKAETVVINVHYLADQIEAYIASLDKTHMPEIVISNERDALLETGGGIKKALPHLGDAPFFVLNSDSIWLERDTLNLMRLIERWEEEQMDCLILLAHCDRSLGYAGKGDFSLLPDGRLSRRGEEAVPFVVSGTYLVHPRLFDDAPDGAFSMNILWDRALAEGRLYGLELDGDWLHIGTPQAVEDAEKYISTHK